MAFAGWVGVEARLGTLGSPLHPWLGTGPRSLFCALVFWIGSRYHMARRADASSGFRDVYRQYAANFGFWGALALGAGSSTRWIGAITLLVLAVIVGRAGWRERRESFLLYAVGYSTIGLVWLESLLLGSYLADILARTRHGDCRGGVVVEPAFPAQGLGALIIARPTVEEERWLLVAARYPALRAAVEQAGKVGAWKSTTWLGRCLGVLLCLFGMSLLAGVLSPLPSPLIVGGLLLVVAAEWLVAQRRVFRSGIEEVLYLGGAAAVVAQLLIWSHGDNEALAVALMCTTVLLVGWRLLNPMFTTIAVAGYSLAIALAGVHLFGGKLHMREAAIACAVLAVVALIAGGRTWQRPTHDRMLDGLVIVMPWLAYGWLLAHRWNGSIANWPALALAAGFFAVNLVVGVKRGKHAPLIGALGNLACVGYSFHRLSHWPLHWKTIVAGGVLLLVAVLLELKLRHRQKGITSDPIDDPSSLDLVQLAGAASIVPAPGAPPPPGVQGQGGDFGGGGASGRF